MSPMVEGYGHRTSLGAQDEPINNLGSPIIVGGNQKTPKTMELHQDPQTMDIETDSPDDPSSAFK